MLVPVVVKLVDSLAWWIRAKGKAEVLRAKHETGQPSSGQSESKRAKGRGDEK
ncbi:hypothetical protein [Streptomyces sp. NPDC059757]|uniref:hypothetical protein n=1 Tax=Streptomyces sp. NPDC059757 TaxID=3346935 RepID=UPI00364612A6